MGRKKVAKKPPLQSRSTIPNQSSTTGTTTTTTPARPYSRSKPSLIPNAGDGLFLAGPRMVPEGTVLLDEEAVAIKRPEATRLKTFPEGRDCTGHPALGRPLPRHPEAQALQEQPLRVVEPKMQHVHLAIWGPTACASPPIATSGRARSYGNTRPCCNASPRHLRRRRRHRRLGRCRGARAAFNALQQGRGLQRPDLSQKATTSPISRASTAF